MEKQITVAEYLKIRLEQLGLERIFGVAGNYTAPFLNTILKDPQSPIQISGNANEMCAGFAADAYARLKGISAVSVTYSVGAFSLLNTIAGSFVEQVPVILINGAPTNKEDATERNAGLLYSHTTGYQFVNIHMFRPITAAAERITSSTQAIYQIDSAIIAMLEQKKPIYFEVCEDVWRATCPEPKGILTVEKNSSLAVSELNAALDATKKLLQKRPNVTFWAGIEIQRYGLQQQFIELIESINQHSNDEIQFVTSPLSKSVISEDNEHFHGCLTMTPSKIESLTGDNGCIIGIGAWTIGKDTGNQNIRGDGTILAAKNGVFVGSQYFPIVNLEDYMKGLASVVICNNESKDTLALQCLLKNTDSDSLLLKQSTSQTAELGYDSFFERINTWITEDDIMVADAGFSLIGAQNVHIKSENGFIGQAAWLSIGYSVPAGLGIKCAMPDKRAIVVVGDGAFQETCQAVGDQHSYGHNTVVFVISNGLYGIEQYLVNPNPFRQNPIDYKDTLLDDNYHYNNLPSWNIPKLAEGFGGKGRQIKTLSQLDEVLQEIRDDTDSNFVVEICVPHNDSPSHIANNAPNHVGEDEIENPNWPPHNIF